MKISVAIPTYNRAKIIEKTITSITRQIEKVDEIIVVDDGSTDDTESVIRTLNISNLVYKKIANAGPAEARRQAISYCNNEWIALCDSDDIWHTNHIANFKRAVGMYPQTQVYFSNFILSNELDKTKFDSSPEGWWDSIIQESNGTAERKVCLLNREAYNGVLVYQPIFPSALVFNSKLYKDIGGIAHNIGKVNSEDSHLTRRLIAHGVSTCSFTPTVTILKHDNNFSADVIKNYIGRLQILNRLIEQNEIPRQFLDTTAEEVKRSIPNVFNNLYWGQKYDEAVTFYEYHSAQSPYFSKMQKIKYYYCILRKKLML